MGRDRTVVAAGTAQDKDGRPRVSNRKCLTGILFVLKTGVPWEDLPQEMGCGCGMTSWCQERVQDWQAAGVWDKLHRILLDRLGQAGHIDWSRASADSATVPTPRGRSNRAGPDESRQIGTKRHVVVDRTGVPLSVTLSAAHVHDKRMLEAAVDAIPPIKQPRGRPRRRPHILHADKAYDFRDVRQALRRRGIVPRIARCGIDSSERLGRYRWVVDRTLSWLNRYRRLKVRC